MDLTLNLENSPYFLGALLVLLLLVLILRRPTIIFFKFLTRKIKSCKAKRKVKKEKRKVTKEKKKAEKEKKKEEEKEAKALEVKKEVVKVVKVVNAESVKEKFVYVFWQRVLFLILGIGVIISAYFKNLEYFTTKFMAFYDFVFAGTGHNNLTTMIVTLLISIVLLIIIRMITLIEKRNGVSCKIIHYILFSVVAALSLIIMISAINILSLINSIVMGIVFILFGLLIVRKK